MVGEGVGLVGSWCIYVVCFVCYWCVVVSYCVGCFDSMVNWVCMFLLCLWLCVVVVSIVCG